MGVNVTDYDFCGWATMNDLRCADGRIIRRDAFKPQDGQKVPLVWNHERSTVGCTLGHAILENRKEGVYAYCSFNNTQAGQDAKETVAHGDIDSLSIWANNLEQIGPEVVHGVIREVSLVLAGANPGAFIESVVAHGEPMDDGEEEGIFYTGQGLYFSHAIDDTKKEESEEEKKEEPKEEEKEESVSDVFKTLSEKQKKAVAIIVGQAIKDAKGEKNEEEEEDKEMRHNVFEGSGAAENVVTREDLRGIITSARDLGSLKKAIQKNIEDGGVLAHALDTTGMTLATGSQDYGFNDPSMLFPEYKTVSGATPEWISRNMDWVTKFLGAVHHTPFSRIKSLYANITEDEARAKGYIKGKRKKEEVFSTLKRTTDPQTVYKKQKLDRDDIIDITDFDVVAWIRAEMRVMLNEELARAMLIGDGRPADSEDKIQELHVRPIVKDDPLYNTKVAVEVPANATSETIASETIDAMIRARKNYKGSGSPIFFTTEDVLTEMLLLKDAIGHRMYKTEAELATTLRVREIVVVEPMEGYKISIGDDDDLPLIGCIVNPADYNVGADKGGEINTFEDFDIDFNQHKYLIETRISGALIKPFSALTFGLKKGTTVVGG